MRAMDLRTFESEISFWEQLGDFFEAPSLKTYQSVACYDSKNDVCPQFSLEGCINLPKVLALNASNDDTLSKRWDQSENNHNVKTRYCQKSFMNVSGEMIDSSFAKWLYYAYMFEKYKPESTPTPSPPPPPPTIAPLELDPFGTMTDTQTEGGGGDEENVNLPPLDYPGAHVLSDDRVIEDVLTKLNYSYELEPLSHYKKTVTAPFSAWVLLVLTLRTETIDSQNQSVLRWVKCIVDPVSEKASFYPRLAEQESFCTFRKGPSLAEGKRKKTWSFLDRPFYYDCHLLKEEEEEEEEERDDHGSPEGTRPKSRRNCVSVKLFRHSPILKLSFSFDSLSPCYPDPPSLEDDPKSPVHAFLERRLCDKARSLITEPSVPISYEDFHTKRRRDKFRTITERRMHNALVVHGYAHGITYIPTFGSIVIDRKKESDNDKEGDKDDICIDITTLSSEFQRWYKGLAPFGSAIAKKNQILYFPPMTELKDNLRAYPYDNSPQTRSFFLRDGCQEFYGWETVSPTMPSDQVERWKTQCDRELINATLPSRYVKFYDRELPMQTVRCNDFKTFCENAKARFETQMVALYDGTTGERVCNSLKFREILAYSFARRVKRPLPPAVFCDNLIPKESQNEGGGDHDPSLFYLQTWNDADGRKDPPVDDAFECKLTLETLERELEKIEKNRLK